MSGWEEVRGTAAVSAALGVLLGAAAWRWLLRRTHRASGRSPKDGPPLQGPLH